MTAAPRCFRSGRHDLPTAVHARSLHCIIAGSPLRGCDSTNMDVANAVPVLVVEDEIMVSMIIEEALSDGGYHVTTARTADWALAHLASGDVGFRALVTDIRLEGRMTGWDIARRARELRPNVAVVYVSADSGAKWPSLGVPGSRFIQKPFTIDQIVTAVSSLLSRTSPET